MSKKHILLVGLLRVAHKQLKKFDPKMTLMIQSDRLKLADSSLCDRIFSLPTTANNHAQEWIELAKVVHRLDPITHVGGFHETTQQEAAVIAQALDLPYHPPAVIKAVCHKATMRRLLREAGVDPTACAIVQTGQEIKDFAARYSYPVILKPVDGRGSTGVSLIRSRSEIPGAVAWLQTWAPGAEMLVEQYLEGEEFSVEGFSENGKHRIMSITKKYKETTHFVELGHILPAPLDDATQAAIHNLIQCTLTAVGIAFGPSHTEIILTKDGPHVVETHARLAGDYIPELIEILCEVNPTALWVRQTLGEDVLSFAPTLGPGTSYAAVWFVSPNATGRIEHIEGENVARAMPGVKQVEILQGVGTTLQGVHDSFSRAAYVIAVGESPEDALKKAQEASSQLKFGVLCSV
jgi:biotin carboxylase